MLIPRLVEYSRRLALPPTLYVETPVRYLIDLDSKGVPLGIVDTATSERGQKRGKPIMAPQVKRTSGVTPLLLADNAEYTLGLARETSVASRVASAHEAYLALLERCYGDTQSAGVEAVRRFYERGGHSTLELPADFDRGATMTFRVDNTFVVDDVSVQQFWAGVNASTDAPSMQCLGCGQQRPVLERLQGSIKGIPDGQTSGTSLISANADAFESYGLKASLTAPTCADCAERFTKALNHLLASDSNHVRLGSSVAVFWTSEDTADSGPASLLLNPQPDEVRAFLQSPRSGKRVGAPDAARFYAVILSAAGARAVVREWIDVALPEAEAAIRQWFTRQAVIDLRTGERRYFGLMALAGATERDLKDVPPPVKRALWRAALTGGRMPTSLLSAAVRRAQAEGQVTAAHVSLIKLVLLSHLETDEENELVELQPDHPSAAYQCGRLMAVLETVQQRALPNVKAGIVDRFFSSASSTPVGAFPRLLRGAQPHLNVLKREKRGTYVALQRRLEEVLAHLPSFPRVLTMDEQGLFVLGYYHQRADDRLKAQAAKARLTAGAATEEDEGEADVAES